MTKKLYMQVMWPKGKAEIRFKKALPVGLFSSSQDI